MEWKGVKPVANISMGSHQRLILHSNQHPLRNSNRVLLKCQRRTVTVVYHGVGGGLAVNMPDALSSSLLRSSHACDQSYRLLLLVAVEFKWMHSSPPSPPMAGLLTGAAGALVLRRH